MLFWTKKQTNFKGKKSWHPQLVLVGKPADTQEVAKLLARESTVSPADVHAVIRALPEVMAELMAQGRAVHLDGLGSFRYTAQSAGHGVETEAEVSANQITGLRVQFTPARKKEGTVITRALVGLVSFMEWKGKSDKSTTKPGEGGNSGDGSSGSGGDDPGMWG
jgi:predicted histone-like DNA-binding protein